MIKLEEGCGNLYMGIICKGYLKMLITNKGCGFKTQKMAKVSFLWKFFNGNFHFHQMKKKLFRN